MLRRGYNHKSPLEQPDFLYLSETDQAATVDVVASLRLLRERCPECRRRMEEFNV
jgi:hypothetical protein